MTFNAGIDYFSDQAPDAAPQAPVCKSNILNRKNMAIYELFDQEKIDNFNETFDHVPGKQDGDQSGDRGSFFSTLVTRVFFLLLLVADTAWFVYNCIALIIVASISRVTGKRKLLRKSILNLQRSAACHIALFVGLFSPPFGIMVACTYFLMYDKAGMEEVVPAPLQAQFKDIFTTDK